MNFGKRVKIFFGAAAFAVCLLVPSEKAVFAECADGETCLPACPNGFTQSANKCNVSTGLDFSEGVCCKQNVSECEAAGNECAFSCAEGDQLSGLGQKGCTSYQVCCKKKTAEKPAACKGECRPNDFSGSAASPCRDDENADPGDCPGNFTCCVSKTSQQPTTGAPTTGSAPGSSSGTANTGGLIPCDTNCTLCHIVIGFKKIFDFFIGLLFVATMLAVTVAGVFYMISAGSKTLTETAKKSLTYALMAFVIGMGAWIIVNTIMVGLGFKHPYGGNWWEFTCDTSKSQGPVSSGSAPNWNAGKDNSNESGECTPTGNGCGGMSAPGVAGCDYTSAKLSQVMACMNQKVSGAKVTSVTKNNLPDWCQKCVWDYAGEGTCSHVENSCHFGGRNCKGTAQAADMGGANLNTMAAAARECGGEYVIFYSSFIHVSVNNAECGCK